jgi:hypothetical protein
MHSENALLVALLIVLVIIIASQGGVWRRSCFEPFKGAGADAGAPAATDPFPKYRGGRYNPYTVLNNQLSEIRGSGPPGFDQPPFWRQPHGLDRYHRTGASIRPEELAQAEREAWYDAVSADRTGAFNTELAHDPQSDVLQYHTAQPALDYDSFITDLVLDPRARENQRRWVEEMQPWSGTAMMVDDMEEAMEASTDFIGLRRPQAIVQYNPLQLTERDANTFVHNPKFNFRG